MRPLAIARFRLWTTVRAATPFAILACAAPLVALAVEVTMSNMWMVVSPDMSMSVCATAAMISWMFHMFILLGITHEFGNPRIESETTVHPADLMDTVPIPPAGRSAGEFTGALASAILIHVCCLPVLALVAALSPLPTRLFAVLEGLNLALMVLASSSAAWRRVVLGVKRSKGMQATRNVLMLLLIVTTVAILTTKPIEFRDAAFQAVTGPSKAAWIRVLGTIEHPFAMVALLAAVYTGYVAFYFLSSLRRAPQD